MNNIDSLMKNINYKFKNISNLNEALPTQVSIVAQKFIIMKG